MPFAMQIAIGHDGMPSQHMGGMHKTFVQLKAQAACNATYQIVAKASGRHSMCCACGRLANAALAGVL